MTARVGGGGGWAGDGEPAGAGGPITGTTGDAAGASGTGRTGDAAGGAGTGGTGEAARGAGTGGTSDVVRDAGGSPAGTAEGSAAAERAGTVAVEREMGCTREDLLRWLPGATGHAPAREEGDELVLAVAGGEVRIHADPRPPRRIALLELPVLAVRFRFTGMDPAAREAFLARFDLYTRRGGG